jgi:hypothetical protein
VGWLRDTDVASHALKDTAPTFLLPGADGRLHSSEQLRRNGPLVLSEAAALPTSERRC